MRKATAHGLLILCLAAFTSCGRASGVKSGAAASEALFGFLPRSTTYVLVLNVRKLMTIDAVAKAMDGPGFEAGIFGFFKVFGIDPRQDVSYIGFGAPHSEYLRRLFLGLPRRQAITENSAFIVDLRYDKSRLLSSIKEHAPEVREDMYNGVAIYSRPGADDREKWIKAALLDATHIVLGSDKGVRDVIDVYQKTAEPLSKSPEMATLMEKVDTSGIAWCAAPAPAELFQGLAGSNPQLADLEWLTGITMAVDDKGTETSFEFRALGGTAEQNSAEAAFINGLRAYGTMHLAKEPALEALLNSIDISSGNGYIRLTASASHEAVGQLWRLARRKVEDPTKPDKGEPQEIGADVSGSPSGREGGIEAEAAFREKILAQGEEMHRAFMSNDIDAYITYILPELIEGMGGESAFRQAIQPVLAQMKQINVKISLGTISPVVSEADGLAAFVPVEMDLRIKGIRIIQISYYVAVSRDMGLTWKFMSSQGQPQQDKLVKQMFPKLTSRMPIPKCGQFVPFWE